MLKRLSIQNLATIESLAVEFAPGLNALTGETGAGKSILIGGLELALGERASAETIRAGQSLAVVEATFAEPLPAALGALVRNGLELEWPPGEPLTIRRELSRSGRNRCFINGQMVGVTELKTIGEWLVDLHGQHEHQSLLRSHAARSALDAFAGHEKLVEAYAAAWAESRRLRHRRDELDAAAADFQRRADYLDFQLQELDKLDPRPGELAELEQEEKRLAHAETLTRAAAEAYCLLYAGAGGEEGPSALALLREVERRLTEIGHVEPIFAAQTTQLAETRVLLEDLAFSLRDYAEEAQADPERLNAVIGRIEALRKLARKHGGTEQTLHAAWAALREERERMTADDVERRTIEKQLARAESDLHSAGAELSTSRQRAADRFAKGVLKILRELCMEQSKFELSFEPHAEPQSDGLERIEFLLAANPGLPLAPLPKVASGGELSRVMHALKSTLAARDAIPTLVFDEIDAGISGEASRRVGALMERLGATHQVLCITHHAPIAARAAWHAVVRKKSGRGATFSEIAVLDHAERVEEIARMMAGEASPAAARELARELMA